MDFGATPRRANGWQAHVDGLPAWFGQIKQARGFRQFLLRGVKKVRAEWAMICTTHNLLKLRSQTRPQPANLNKCQNAYLDGLLGGRVSPINKRITSMKEKLFGLSSKVAIVTGGNGGIGLGMARGLADAGAAIAVVGRNEVKSATAVADLKERGVKAIAVDADVTDKAAVAAMIARVEKRTRPHRHPHQQCRHQRPQAAAFA